MSTTLVAPDAFVAELRAERERRGLDGRDEVWEGVYHVAPHEHSDNGLLAADLQEVLREAARRAGLRAGGSFNLGQPDDYRVPDLGYHRGRPGTLYVATAPLVVEVLSPEDETWRKLPFYFARGVEEVWVVDPADRAVRVHVRGATSFTEAERSALLDLAAADVASALDWP